MATEQETAWAQRVLDYVRWQQVDRGPAPDVATLPPRYHCFARDVPIGLRAYILRHKAAHLADCIERRKPIFSPRVHTDAEAVARMAMTRAQELATVIGGGSRSGGPKRR